MAHYMHDTWADWAYGHLLAIAGSLPDEDYLTARKVQAVAHDRGLPKPKHLRAWGGVFRRAANAGALREVFRVVEHQPLSIDVCGVSTPVGRPFTTLGSFRPRRWEPAHRSLEV